MKIPKIQLPKKPQYVKFGEDLDFYGFFRKIEQRFDKCFILESLGEHSHFSRYSIIGFAPEHTISGKGMRLTVDDTTFKVQNPYYALRKVVPQDIIARDYAGGLFGYLSYEALSYFEPALAVKVHESFDQFKFGVYIDGLVLDKQTGELFYFYYNQNRVDLLHKLRKAKIKRSGLKVQFVRDTLTKKEHATIVENVKEEIRAGNTFQCQVGFKTEYSVKGDLLKIYTRLRQVNPSPHMFYVKFGEQKIIGASPELLFRLRNDEMETFPLAGTVCRGEDKEEDIRLARQLLQDPKEIAEHNMLVDLHRNDLGRVAKFGTVKVRSLMDIKKFSHVQHISSELVGMIRDGEDMFSGLATSCPTGTLTGAPKIESIKIIDRNEPKARGPYGGALGHFGFNGDCTFAIPIRTLFIAGEHAYTQTSGGIVYDSQPHKEYEEIQRKLAAMKEVLRV